MHRHVQVRRCAVKEVSAPTAAVRALPGQRGGEGGGSGGGAGSEDLRTRYPCAVFAPSS